MKNYLSPSIEMVLMSTEDVLRISFIDEDNISTWDDLFGGEL